MTQEDVLSGVLAGLPEIPAPPVMPTPPGIKNTIQFPALLPGMPMPPALPILMLPGMEKIPAPPGVKILDEKGMAIAVGVELPKLPTLPAPPGLPAAIPVPEALPKEKLGKEEIAALLAGKEPGMPSKLEAEIIAMGDGMVLTTDEEWLREEELEL